MGLNTTSGDTKYINSVSFNDLTGRMKDVIQVMDTLFNKNETARKLRYTDIDVEKERASNRLAPDELYIPQHIIDTNIRNEQSAYVQYVVQSNRAVVLVDIAEPAIDVQVMEKDVTDKLRFDGWQLPMFANIDGMQQNGYGVMEVIHDPEKAGHLGYEFVQYGDFGMPEDTKDIQESEMVVRHYYFSKTRLLNMVQTHDFNPVEVDKVIQSAPESREEMTASVQDRTLYRVHKVMFRVQGTVHVAWANEKYCNDWLRAPQPLFVGRREAKLDPMGQKMQDPMTGVPQSGEAYETMYPYFLYPYIISENDTISKLRGRAYLDQDTQEAVTSLLSSFCTAHRRAAGLYFSRDTNDPNDDVLMQKNVYFKPGALINSKVTQMQLTAPGSDLISAIQALISANAAETSQVSWAVQNRKDSRKTATEVNASMQTQQALSTVKVVLFSNSLRNMYTFMFGIIQSRVNSGMLQVPQAVMALYQKSYMIKPSGDTDVIERNQIIQQMQNSWPVMQNTPAAVPFLSDMLVKMFPDNAPKYIMAFQQAQQAQQQQQAQQMQQLMQGIVQLAQSPQMFSEEGKQQALPLLQQAAQQIVAQQQGQPNGQQPGQQPAGATPPPQPVA